MFADHQRISTSGYSSANYSADKYGTEAANDLRRHVIGDESNDRTELNRTSPPNNRPAKNHPSPPLNDTMVSGRGFERKVSGGVGERMVYDLVSRKDTARRNLMGHLYTRQPVLKRSYSFVAGERPATETLLPSLQRREKHSAISFNSERYTKPGRNVNVRDLKQWQSDKNAGKRNGCVQPGKNGSTNQKALNGGRPGSHQISLPELINDINMSSRLHSPGDSDGEDSASAHGHKGPLDLIRSMDMKPASPVKSKAVRYRSITPGVIEKLNKLRLSSKIRTEQWVKTLPLDYRATYSEIDDSLTEPSEHSLKEKEWIYTAT